jgi:hypothetical protein
MFVDSYKQDNVWYINVDYNYVMLMFVYYLRTKKDFFWNKKMIWLLFSSDRGFDGVGADVIVVFAGVPGDGPRNDPGNVEPGCRAPGLRYGISKQNEKIK